MIFIGLFYLLFPSLLLTILFLKKQPGVLLWILTVLLTGVSILFIWTIARWEIVSIYFRPIFPVVYFIGIFVSYRRIEQKQEKSKLMGIFNITINIIVTFVMGVFCVLALRGYKTPETTISLQNPLKDSKSIVLHGGSRPMINAHFHVTPQNYAIDLVGLNDFGMRASIIGDSSKLENYIIYGEQVFSPCTGTVLLAVDTFQDNIPPQTDLKNIAGNHLLIQCDNFEVLLAHFQAGSIQVKVGNSVDNNTFLGRVGNTGNTSEPHLHMHVETGGIPNTILNGKAIPFKIENRFLVRGDVLN